jgi:hypothetical protein
MTKKIRAQFLTPMNDDVAGFKLQPRAPLIWVDECVTMYVNQFTCLPYKVGQVCVSFIVRWTQPLNLVMNSTRFMADSTAFFNLQFQFNNVLLIFHEHKSKSYKMMVKVVLKVTKHQTKL